MVGVRRLKKWFARPYMEVRSFTVWVLIKKWLDSKELVKFFRELLRHFLKTTGTRVVVAPAIFFPIKSVRRTFL